LNECTHFLCHICNENLFSLSVVEQFQDLGYRPLIAKDESTCVIQDKLDARGQMVSNILVSRYAQKALTGNISHFYKFVGGRNGKLGSKGL